MRLLVDPFQLGFMQRALAAVLLVGVLAAVTGVFVVLRRLAFVGDTLTHTVFPGVVVAYLAGWSIFLGALAFGVLSALLLTVLSANRRVSVDAAVAVLVLAALAVMRKELLLRAFDPDGAAALGYRTVLLDLPLNVLIALVVVAGVKAVGTALMIALIIVPAAAARLVTDRVGSMAALAAALGAVGGYAGLVISYDVSLQRGVRLAAGATVVVVLVAFFLVALAVQPLRAALARRALARQEAR